MKHRIDDVLILEEESYLEALDRHILPLWVKYGGIAAASALILARMGGIAYAAGDSHHSSGDTHATSHPSSGDQHTTAPASHDSGTSGHPAADSKEPPPPPKASNQDQNSSAKDVKGPSANGKNAADNKNGAAANAQNASSTNSGAALRDAGGNAGEQHGDMNGKKVGEAVNNDDKHESKVAGVATMPQADQDKVAGAMLPRADQDKVARLQKLATARGHVNDVEKASVEVAISDEENIAVTAKHDDHAMDSVAKQDREKFGDGISLRHA